jgi:hypothetical protein
VEETVMDIVTYALLNGKIKDYASNVDEWLEENVDPATGYVLDRSLQMENAAAPADIVGDINDDVGELRNTLNNVENGLAIIVDGDTCSTAVPVGGYAYIKNNTHGLAEGLYKNTSSSAFPVSGGTANGLVFTAFSGGGLNDIKNDLNISTAYLIPNSDIVSVSYGMTVAKSGNTKIANLICAINEITDTEDFTTLCDIPSGFLPATKYEIQIFISSIAVSIQLNANSDDILIRPAVPIGPNAVIVAQIVYF